MPRAPKRRWEVGDKTTLGFSMGTWHGVHSSEQENLSPTTWMVRIDNKGDSLTTYMPTFSPINISTYTYTAEKN